MSIPYLNSNTPNEDDSTDFLTPKTIIAILKVASFISILAFGVGFVLMPYFM